MWGEAHFPVLWKPDKQRDPPLALKPPALLSWEFMPCYSGGTEAAGSPPHPPPASCSKSLPGGAAPKGCAAPGLSSPSPKCQRPPNPPHLLVNGRCLESGDVLLRLLDEALETCPQRFLAILSSWEPRGGSLRDGGSSRQGGARKEPGKRRAHPPLSEHPVAPLPGPQLSSLAGGTLLRATVASSASRASSSKSGILIFPRWVLCREKGSPLARKGAAFSGREGWGGSWALGSRAGIFQKKGQEGEGSQAGSGAGSKGHSRRKGGRA